MPFHSVIFSNVVTKRAMPWGQASLVSNVVKFTGLPRHLSEDFDARNECYQLMPLHSVVASPMVKITGLPRPLLANLQPGWLSRGGAGDDHAARYNDSDQHRISNHGGTWRYRSAPDHMARTWPHMASPTHHAICARPTPIVPCTIPTTEPTSSQHQTARPSHIACLLSLYWDGKEVLLPIY